MLRGAARRDFNTIGSISSSGNRIAFNGFLNNDPGVLVGSNAIGNAIVANSLFSEFSRAIQLIANQPPTANAGGPYTVAEGGSSILSGSGSDPDSDPLTFSWDLDNNGSFETAGQNPIFLAAGRDGPDSQIVVLQVCDLSDACGTSTATVNINNVAPTATFSNDGPVNEGSTATVSFSGQSNLARRTVFTEVLNLEFKQIYGKIRNQLTGPERRAFQLLYFRQPIFANEIAAFDPVAQGFLWRMDDETRSLVVLALVFKQRTIGDHDVVHELEARWRSYLRFYPIWSELIADDERERKREKSRRSRTVSLENPVTMNADEIVGETRGDDLPHEVVYSVVNDLRDVTSEFCTPRQRQYIVAHFRHGKSQQDIAQEYSISQQAVSKVTRQGLHRIREGLIASQAVELR